MTFRTNLVPLLLTLPILFFKFWFFEGPQFWLGVVGLLVKSAINILSIPILLRTYFAPWKGEYRKGYVGLARGVGMVVRTFMIIGGTVVVAFGTAIGLLLILVWIGAPIAWTVLWLQTMGVIKFV